MSQRRLLQGGMRSLLLCSALLSALVLVGAGASCERPGAGAADAGTDGGAGAPEDAGPPPLPDETPPVVSFVSPDEGCLEGEVELSFEVKDEGSGVGFVSATFAARALALSDDGQGRYRATFDVAGLSTGPHALHVTAIDLENNLTEAERRYGTAREGEYFEEQGLACGTPPPPPPEDNEPPTVQIVTPSAEVPAFASTALPVGAVVTDDVGPVTVFASIGDVSAALSGVNGSFSGTLDVSGLASGVYDLVVTATDAASRSASDTHAVIVDHSPPAVVIVEPTAGATRAALNDVICQASDDHGVTRVLLYEQGGTEPLGIATTPAPNSDDRYGIFYHLPCAGLPRDMTFEMRAFDAAGNVGSASVTVSVTVDGCEP